jgi:ketosteroid isomerase-like protein
MTRRVPLKHAVALSLLLSIASSAEAMPPMVTPERQIRQLEQQLNDALSSIDVKTIDKIWADDFVFVNPSGRITNKVQRMAGLKPRDTSMPSLMSTIDDVQVRVFGTMAVAIVKTTWRGTVDAKPILDRYVATHVWKRSGARWRLTSAHVSHVELEH